jgi:hypothetical protein
MGHQFPDFNHLVTNENANDTKTRYESHHYWADLALSRVRLG